jgi:hypothetical protein
MLNCIVTKYEECECLICYLYVRDKEDTGDSMIWRYVTKVSG